jgi:hypothetical protein
LKEGAAIDKAEIKTVQFMHSLFAAEQVQPRDQAEHFVA